MNQDGQQQPTPLTEQSTDPYIRRCVELANSVNRLHNDLEKIIEVEEARKSPFLDNLVQIEAWLDRVATLAEKRLAYVESLKPGQGPPAS